MVFGSRTRRTQSMGQPPRSSRTLRNTRERENGQGAFSARSAPRSSRSTARSSTRASGRQSTAKGVLSGVSNSARSIRSGRMTAGRVFRKESSAPPAPRGKDGEVGGIRVAVRFRPLSDKERQRGDISVWGVDESNNVGVCIKGNFSPKYHYDTVFEEDRDNRFVYETVASDIVSKAMGGVNGTIFAYGVTSSGKTHTMMGNELEMGIVPRTIQHVFELIEQSPGNEYLLRLSMMEIYNEVLNDLFDPKRQNLKVREHKTKGVHVEGLTEVVLESAEQALGLIETGIANRKVSATLVNEGSSRSHTLCRVSIEVNDKSGSRNGGRTLSFLNLIDLAGSESARAAASKGHRMEGSFINKSLLTLGTVIHKLSEAKGKKSHIPFRDSKLTRLLQSSLTGSGSKMAVICCVTPTSSQAEETHNTLKFASRAKKIEIKTTKNEIMDHKSLLARYQREIADLKFQLKEMSEKAAAASEPSASAPDPKLQEELTIMRERLEEELHARVQRDQDKNALHKRIDRLTRLILHSTRAQAENRIPISKLSRSRSYDALMKVKTTAEPLTRRDNLGEINVGLDPDWTPSHSSNRPSFCSEINNSVNSVNDLRAPFPTVVFRSPSISTVALPGEIDKEIRSENDNLREELNDIRKAMADRERELQRKVDENKELRKRLSIYESSNPSTSRSIASEEDETALQYSLLEADRGLLEESLTTAKKEKTRLTNELLRVKIALKRTQKRLQEYEGEPVPPERQVFRVGYSDHAPQSPSNSSSTTDTKLSATVTSLERTSIDERPPRHPPVLDSGLHPEQSMNQSEMHSKIERLADEVRTAFEQLAIKESQIESQKQEIVTFKDEAVAVRQQLLNLAAENERLKMRIQTMKGDQDRLSAMSGRSTPPLSSQQVNNCVGMDSPSNRTAKPNDLLELRQGFLLDNMNIRDLDALRSEIKEASNRVDRAVFSRKLSSIPAYSAEEFDTDSTQDIYVLKGLESDD